MDKITKEPQPMAVNLQPLTQVQSTGFEGIQDIRSRSINDAPC